MGLLVSDRIEAQQQVLILLNCGQPRARFCPNGGVTLKIGRVSTHETGQTPWLDADDDTYYGIFDDTGRMMVVICYNQDIGDGWEWPTGNVGEASTVSFQMAINFILYALTHPRRLADLMDSILTAPSARPVRFDLNGAANTARWIGDWPKGKFRNSGIGELRD